MMQFDVNGFATASGWIFAHCIDHGTGEYLSSQDVYVSVGTTLPAGAFLDEPPLAMDGFAIVRNGDKWQLVEDFRGQTAYNTQTRAEMPITVLGPLESDMTLLPPNSPFDKWDGSQWVRDADEESAASLSSATYQRNNLIYEASQKISILADAIDLGMATDAERDEYTAWRQYRVLLSRVDLTANPVMWPTKPA